MDTIDYAMVGVGGMMVAFGAGLIVAGRRRLSRHRAAAPGAWRRVGGGIALFGVGYHLVAWGLPAGWVPLSAPIGRWWIVACAVAFVVLGTWQADEADEGT